MALYYPYSFEGVISELLVGTTRKIRHTVLFLPEDLRHALPFDHHPRLRVEGEIADVTVSSAFNPAGDGRAYVMVSPAVLKAANVGLGDRAEMRFRIADQDQVSAPDALTPGKKRMLSHYVASAKTAATEAKRVTEAIDALLTAGGDIRAWTMARRNGASQKTKKD